HPFHGGLLQHELTDHDRPRGRVRASPRQVPSMLAVPTQDSPHHGPCSADRQLPVLGGIRHVRHTIGQCSCRRRAFGRVPGILPRLAFMSGLLRPVGPETAQTYWARRALVFGAMTVLAVAVTLIINGTSSGLAVRSNPSPPTAAYTVPISAAPSSMETAISTPLAVAPSA